MNTILDLSLDEALNEVESRAFHLVPGIIDGRATMLVGQSEAGKSTLMADLIAAALQDKPFLGRDFTQPVHRVVVLSADLAGHAEYAFRLKSRGISRSVPKSRLRVLGSVRDMTAEKWAEVQDRVQPASGDLVVLDPMAFTMPDKVQNLFADDAVRAVWNPLGAWSDAGASILVVHHASHKWRASGDGMGSSLFHAAPRINLTMERKGRHVILRTSPNIGRAETLTLRFDPDGMALLGTDDTMEVESAKRAERDQKKAAEFVAKAQWGAKNHPTVSAAEMSRVLVAQFPDLHVASANPARQVARDLSEGRDIGGFLRQENGVWTASEPSTEATAEAA